MPNVRGDLGLPFIYVKTKMWFLHFGLVIVWLIVLCGQKLFTCPNKYKIHFGVTYPDDLCFVLLWDTGLIHAENQYNLHYVSCSCDLLGHVNSFIKISFQSHFIISNTSNIINSFSKKKKKVQDT